MKTEEYLQKQELNYKIYELSSDPEERDKYLIEMVRLKETFFLENLNLCEQKFTEQGYFKVYDPNGEFLFNLSLKDTGLTSKDQEIIDTVNKAVGKEVTSEMKITGIESRKIRRSDFMHKDEMALQILDQAQSLNKTAKESTPSSPESQNSSQSSLKDQLSAMKLEREQGYDNVVNVTIPKPK